MRLQKLRPKPKNKYGGIYKTLDLRTKLNRASFIMSCEK